MKATGIVRKIEECVIIGQTVKQSVMVRFSSSLSY